MIKINDEIIATAEQIIVITQANYDKLTTAEKNNSLKTYFISDGSITAQSLNSNSAAVQPLSLDDDFGVATDDGIDAEMESDGKITDGVETDVGDGTEHVVADENGVVTGAMEDQTNDSTDFVDTDLIGLSIADAIGNASMLAAYGGDGTIIGAIADLYKKLGVDPDTSAVSTDDVQLGYNDYLAMVGDKSVLDQYNMPNVTAALMDLFDRITDAENKAEIARVNAEDAMKAQAEAEAAQAAAEKAQKEAEEAKAETEKDLENATNRANNAEASASSAWKQLHETEEELNAEKTKNELLQSELDAAKKSEEKAGTDGEDTTPSESTGKTGTDSSEDKSDSTDKSTDEVTDETDNSTETDNSSEETETSTDESNETSDTDQSSETTEAPEETVTEDKSEETVETPAESTEETNAKEDTSSETETTEDAASEESESSDDEK